MGVSKEDVVIGSDDLITSREIEPGALKTKATLVKILRWFMGEQ
jgi:hypothetical protein